MGHPGVLPVPNQEAVEKALRAALALGCEPLRECHFDRKNYFYPDLPAGYQISQYDFPLAKGGKLKFKVPSSSHRESPPPPVALSSPWKECHIRRLHLENDAGKLVHGGGKSLCDFNRAGTPLVEIVTEPDLRSPAEAVAFAKELQRTLIAVGASKADMYKGMLRFDASISLRPQGEIELSPRAEIKNLNSFKALEQALLFEERRQRQLWEEGCPPAQQVTVHWDDERAVGVILREKESAADYRYFPEPDIPPIHLTATALDELKLLTVELPHERLEKYRAVGLSDDQAVLLVDDPPLADFYDEVAAYTHDHHRASSVVLTQLLGFLRVSGKKLSEGPRTEQVIELLHFVDDGTISAHAAKEVLEKMVHEGRNARSFIEEQQLRNIVDLPTLRALVREAIEANPQAVADIKSGKEKAMAALVGYIMGKTRGQADPKIVHGLLQKELS
jgi:aspartyl-tRNA(Asn)/glutamyl-tRNA(Gln) amidotransferase subunit B